MVQWTRVSMQGYLALKKMHPLRTLPYAYAQGRGGVIGGWAFSYGRGTPCKDLSRGCRAAAIALAKLLSLSPVTLPLSLSFSLSFSLTL